MLYANRLFGHSSCGLSNIISHIYSSGTLSLLRNARVVVKSFNKSTICLSIKTRLRFYLLSRVNFVLVYRLRCFRDKLITSR